ncbi:interferon-induced protein 44-like [Dreissena polymorpha]|nr:interferon-induced protein 44-like [Dreissena polymorpha]
MLYKISRDGCNSQTFHQKCDKQGPTVTLLYNQQDSVYGGFVSVSWNSNGNYIQDTNAFLFQLKYSGTDKSTKFSIMDAKCSTYGSFNYGPTFGGGHDFKTFKHTINSSVGYFSLNELSEAWDLIQQYGQRKKTPPKLPQPWRKTPDWNDKYLKTLTEAIEAFKPSGELGVSDVRILMLGPVGAGKSSFYNTINSVFKDHITKRAPCGVSTQGITLAFNPLAQISTINPGFVHQPRLTEKIHCVVFVIDASTINDIPPKLVKRIKSFQRLINRKAIPEAVLLTKVDLACHDVASTIKNLFTSKTLEDAVNKVSGLLGLPRNNILPVKNYENEMQLDDNISILTLLALRQLLHFAEDYIEHLKGKMNARKSYPQNLDTGALAEKGSDQE